eukprot:940338-Prymnesium_polylepis.1
MTRRVSDMRLKPSSMLIRRCSFFSLRIDAATAHLRIPCTRLRWSCAARLVRARLRQNRRSSLHVTQTRSPRSWPPLTAMRATATSCLANLAAATNRRQNWRSACCSLRPAADQPFVPHVCQNGGGVRNPPPARLPRDVLTSKRVQAAHRALRARTITVVVSSVAPCDRNSTRSRRQLQRVKNATAPVKATQQSRPIMPPAASNHIQQPHPHLPSPRALQMARDPLPESLLLAPLADGALQRPGRKSRGAQPQQRALRLVLDRLGLPSPHPMLWPVLQPRRVGHASQPATC